MLQVRTGEVQLLKLAGAQELPEEGPPSALGVTYGVTGYVLCPLGFGPDWAHSILSLPPFLPWNGNAYSVPLYIGNI